MTRSSSLVCAGLLVGSLLAHPALASPHADVSITRVISSDAKTFQGELDRAVADGYRLAAGDAGIEVAIFERAGYGRKRAYLFVDVDRFLKEIEAAAKEGFRLAAFTMGPTEFLVVMEKR
jgi:hypothetical protein